MVPSSMTSLTSFASSQSTAQVALWAYHLEKGQLWWNQEMYLLFDIPHTTVPSWEILEQCFKPSHQGLWLRLQQMLKTGAHYYQENLERLASGPVWLECTAFLDATGSVVGSFKDISAQQRLWTVLQKQQIYQEQLNQLAYQLELSPELILEQGLALLQNYYPLSAAHVVRVWGDTVEVVAQVDRRANPSLPILRAGQRMALQNSFIQHFYARDGVFSGDELLSESVLHARLEPYELGPMLGTSFCVQGKVAGTVLCFRAPNQPLAWDIHQRQFLSRFAHWVSFVLERAQCMAQLEQLSLNKDRLLATVAHDLREPLNVVAQSSQLLKKKAGTLVGKDARIWEMIDTACRNANGLIEELLEVAELEGEPPRLPLEQTDLLQLLEQILAGFQARAQAKDIQLGWDDRQPLPLVALHRLKISRVFENLLNNALKFTPEGGQICLSLRRDGDEACFEIRDTGIGIPPESQSALFEAFSDARRTGLQGEHSTGLGMYIVHEIVRLHGGQIAVASAEGQGTCFTLRLPLLQTP